MIYLPQIIPGLAVPGSPWHLAGLPERLPWTGEVVTIGRVANLGQGPGPGLRFPAGGKEVHRRRRASICGYG